MPFSPVHLIFKIKIDARASAYLRREHGSGLTGVPSYYYGIAAHDEFAHYALDSAGRTCAHTKSFKTGVITAI